CSCCPLGSEMGESGLLSLSNLTSLSVPLRSNVRAGFWCLGPLIRKLAYSWSHPNSCLA
ncbi:MAG: hypothetical protein ACI84E_000510, partial [Planctomycetota bacterium]